jgi:kynurenine 3-monooxygenase
MKTQDTVIVGAGLAGSLLAIYLAKKGFNVRVYERRPDLRKINISAGRSINLALSTRGIFALNEVGVLDAVMRDAIPMRGRMIHSPEGGLAFQQYGKSPSEVINSISRGGLNAILMDAAEATGKVTFYFNRQCRKVDLNNAKMQFINHENGEKEIVEGGVIFGCDGAYSAIRWEMLKSGRFNYCQDYLEHGYKELTIPPKEDRGFRMEKNALHIWPRGSYMLIALPNPDGSFTCTLFLPFEGKNSFAQLTTPKETVHFFAEQFPDVLPLMPFLTKDFFNNPTGTLVTIRCFPWFINDKFLLLGDAAHAIVPFYGQGMNCAFEDCTILNQCIEKHGDSWIAVFNEFQKLRKENTDAIAQLALDNFVEMRDKVADPIFLLKKKLEIKLEEAFPGEFRSTYARVTFERAPYAEALRIGRIQDQVLIEICRKNPDMEKLNLDEIFNRIKAAI